MVVAAIGLRDVASAMVSPVAINSVTLLGYSERFLCPELRPGDVVVMDKLAVHKAGDVEDTIRVVGAELLYLPP